MAHPFEFGNRQSENAAKLAVYDRLAAGDAKSAAADEKNQIAQKKLEFEQRFKEAEQQRKIETSQGHIDILKERNDLIRQQQEVQDKVAELKMEAMKAELAQTTHKLDRSIAVAKQSADMYSELERVRNKDGLVNPADLGKIRVKFWEAAAHDNNFAQLQSEVKRWDTHQAEIAKINATSGKNAAGTTTIVTKDPNGGEVRTTVPNPQTGTPEYQALQAKHDQLQAGLKDASGNYLTGDALKAQIALLNPVKAQLRYAQLDNTGQPIPGQPVPAPVAPSTPSPTVVPVVTPGTTPAAVPVATAPVPDAAAAHLVQNPHLAADFDAKYGEGASAKILTPPAPAP